jgi:serine/threonine protein kinase
VNPILRPDDLSSKRSLSPIKTVFPQRDFFQKYDVVERVGQGGQGEVWKTWDYELRRFVAMKRLAIAEVDSAPALYRFLAEAQITSQLEHPGILPIFDVGLDPDDRPYYTTSLLSGLTLQDVWQKADESTRREWPLSRIITLLERVCEILGFAHSRSVIHRDLKPQNILVGAFGDVRVADWGAAYVMPGERRQFEETLASSTRGLIQTDRNLQIWADPASPLATQTAGIPMTIIFSPPEIVAGHYDELGPATDVYAVGVMLYELLTGKLPYAGEDGKLPQSKALRDAIIHGPPRPVQSLIFKASRDLVSICEKAMARARTDRYQNMLELSDEFRAWSESRPVLARKPGPLLKLQKWTARNIPLVSGVTVICLIASIAIFVTRAANANRDAARQITAVRSAELAARSGRWRQALQFLDDAQSAGYKDTIYLGLSRAEAWTALNESKRAEAELARLMRRSDLGEDRGAVLLRTGEREMFNSATVPQGVEHIIAAVAAGLTPADDAFAKGLLAQSTEDALSFFQQALVLNPYHHGAHVAVLGLDFLLGRRQEVETQCRIFGALYPDDPSPIILSAMEFASENRLREAQARLQTITKGISSEGLNQTDLICKKLSAAAAYYDLDRYLTRGFSATESVMQQAAVFELPGGLFASSDPDEPVRVPQLPCVKEGMLESLAGVHALMSPIRTNPTNGVEKVKSGWEHHPEALMPLLAGLALDRYRAADRSHSTELISQQSDLYQTAAQSSSFLPGLQKLTRYLAAKTQFELAQCLPSSEPAVRACLRNVEIAISTGNCSAMELGAYYEFAFKLGNYDLARELLDRWKTKVPGCDLLVQKSVELELKAGNLISARNQLNSIFAKHPNDPWATAQEEILLSEIRAVSAPEKRR